MCVKIILRHFQKNIFFDKYFIFIERIELALTYTEPTLIDK